MLKISVIGIGNAGNQVAELAKRMYDIPGIAINSSEKDTSTLKYVDSIVIGDEKGAGKDRNIAKSFIKTHIKDLLAEKKFADLMEPADVVFIVSSTGGGTGSGMAPVLRDLLSRVYTNKRFVLMGILPPLKESIAAQQNSIDYLKEMRMTNPTYAIYDNSNFSNKSVIEMLTTVNKEIVEDMLVVRGDYQKVTPYNSIDEKDMLKMIETTGRLVFSRTTNIKEKDIDDKSVEHRLIDSLKSNAHAELDRDQIINKLGLIINLNEKIYKSMDTNLPELKDFVGEPLEGFEHIYLNQTEQELNRAIAILSGLSVPDDRIEKIAQRIEEASSQFTRTKESSALDDVDTDFIKSLRGSTDKEEKKETKVDLDAIFGDYM